MNYKNKIIYYKTEDFHNESINTSVILLPVIKITAAYITTWPPHAGWCLSSCDDFRITIRRYYILL